MGAVQTGKRILRGLLCFLGACALLFVGLVGLSMLLEPMYFTVLNVPFNTNNLLAGALVGLTFGLVMRPAKGLRFGNLAALAGGLAVAMIAYKLGNPSSICLAVGLLVAVHFAFGGMAGALLAFILRLGYAVINLGKSDKTEPPKAG